MRKVSYITFENILADDPYQESQEKIEFSIAEKANPVAFFSSVK